VRSWIDSSQIRRVYWRETNVLVYQASPVYLNVIDEQA